jgi:hypothetical protein
VAGEKQGTFAGWFGVNLSMGLFRHLGKARHGTIARIRLLIPLLLSALFVSACGQYQWHQKLTVIVDTPNGPVAASSVMAWHLTNHRDDLIRLPESAAVSFALSGEAVVLQVAPGRYLFALLKGVPSLGEMLYPKMDVIDSAKLLENGNNSGARDFTLDQKHYPLLVTFGDINDPASVKRVDPDNLELAFGPGYALQSITLSITDEPVTKGEVEKVLGWLGRHYNTHLDGNDLETIKAKDRFANSLASGDFDTEKNK